jgi:SufE protein probably involved in Fe-S center assembly
MTLKERQDKFIAELNEFDEWHEKFNYIIELGNEMPEMPEHLRVPVNRLEFCTSKTFFAITGIDELEVYGWSNSTIPQGLAAVCARIFGGLTYTNVEGQEIYFHTKSGLMDNLTLIRAQSLEYMIKKCVFK